MMDGQKSNPQAAQAVIEYTPRAEEVFYAVVDHPAFFQQDGKLIYQALLENLRAYVFGDYLKRYIYRKAEFSQPFETITLGEYQDIIVDSFQSRGVPASFEPTTSKVRAVAKNWLTQQTVSRDAVLLLGFGLSMTTEDVDAFLTKGLKESGLNLRNPREAVCRFCYEHGLGYYKYQDLMLAAKEKKKQEMNHHPDSRLIKQEEQSEEELLTYVSGLLTDEGDARADREAATQLKLLYRQAQSVTADILNAEKNGVQQANEDTGSSAYNREQAKRSKKTRKKISPEQVTPSDIERVLQAAIPKDRHGNLLRMNKSSLYGQFKGRRLSRQRLEELLSESAQISRYDLITLFFYIYSQTDNQQSKQHYYRSFVEQINNILKKSGMGPLYMANPFECFLQMCIMSDDPLGTYADVIEQSYNTVEQM